MSFSVYCIWHLFQSGLNQSYPDNSGYAYPNPSAALSAFQCHKQSLYYLQGIHQISLYHKFSKNDRCHVGFYLGREGNEGIHTRTYIRQTQL